MTRPIEALPRGDFSPLSCPCPYGAHRFFPIIAQDFSPGSLAGRPKVVKADKVCDQIFKEVIVYDQGPRVETLGRLARRPRNKKSSQGHALGAFPPLLIVLF